MTPRQIIARAVCCLNSGKCGNETCGVPCGQLGTIPTPSLMTADAILAALGAAGMAVVERSRNNHVSCIWNPICDLVWAENRRIDDAKHTAAQAPGDG